MIAAMVNIAIIMMIEPGYTLQYYGYHLMNGMETQHINRS